MKNIRLHESEAGIKIAARKNNIRYANNSTLMAQNEEELKSLLMKVKEESEKAFLKCNIKTTTTRIMTSSANTSRQIERARVEAMTDFLFLGSKLIADGDCSHEIRRLLLGRKVLTN